MVKIFNTKQVDWLGYKITKENPLTYHHCRLKAVHGCWKDLDKDYNLNNGALLTNDSHKKLHQLERDDFEEYSKTNKVLSELNETRKPPTEEHWQKVKTLKHFKVI